MFVLAFENNDHGDKNVERNSHRKYLLPRLNITNYNILIDRRNFYDQPTNDQINRTRPGLWLNFQYFKYHYQLIAFDLSKQKELDADPKSIQQIEFYS